MVEVRFARPDERAAVAQFMEVSFPKAKWGPETWTALVSGCWIGNDGPYAVIALDGAQIVGVLGLVCAIRQTPAGPHQTANMTSWYVAKTHRSLGVGSQILRFLEEHPHLTLTNFASAKNAIPVLERAGFKVLDDTRLNWHPGPGGGITLHDNPLHFSALPAEDRKVFKDHAGLNLTNLAIETPDGLCTMMLSIKQKYEEFVTYEVMYLNHRDVFAAHAKAIAGAILPGSGAVLSIDRRFVSGDANPDEVTPIPVPRFWRGGTIPLSEIDHVYSEIVLSDQKMS